MAKIWRLQWPSSVIYRGSNRSLIHHKRETHLKKEMPYMPETMFGYTVNS